MLSASQCESPVAVCSAKQEFLWQEPKAPVLSSIGRALSFKRSNGNGNGTGNGNGYRSNGGSRPMSPARSQRSQASA